MSGKQYWVRLRGATNHQGAVPPKTPILAVFGDFLMKGAKWYQTERAIEFVRSFYIGKVFLSSFWDFEKFTDPPY